MAISGANPEPPNAAMCRKALRIAQALRPTCDLVVIARDLDRKRTRDGFDQARKEHDWPFAVLCASPDPEVEAWMIAGFNARAAHEEGVLQKLTQQLGFNPTLRPHRLTSTARGSAKDAKAVLAELVGDDPQRRRDCLKAPLTQLAERGEECGLARFLRDVRTVVLPLVLGYKR